MQPPPPDAMQVSTSTLAIVATLAALLGSIFTGAIGKILDLIQKNQEHKYSLQKAFFEKKLKVGEALVTYTRKTMGLVGPMNILLKKTPDLATLPKGPVNIPDFVQAEIERLSSQLKTLVQEIDDSIYAADLYFDNPMPHFGNQYERLLSSFMKVAFIINKASSLKSADGMNCTPEFGQSG
jgi:hypothetical protein